MNTDMERDLKYTEVVPSGRQLRHQMREFYAFVHYTVNTYTDKEWGDGTESESVFDPTDFDARQMVEAVKSAGMTALILTCKHHDGFCLWPSAFTEHSVKNSPYRCGGGDIVREFADACREYGIEFGVYLSPWDRNNKLYGTGKLYDDYFVQQLTELLTNYGEICSVWFDGACGEGPNGKKQYYDWNRYYDVIRVLAPDACIHVCGPDVRWCGNEAGHTRESEWSVVPARTAETEMIAEKSQQADDTEFREREIKASDMDLGSRDALKDENELIWYPAEVNTSIRPGWFYHTYEDDKVKSVDELFDVYCKSVGGNATFLLNIPPTPAGRFHENDVKILKELGEKIQKELKTNRKKDVIIAADSCEEGHDIGSVLTDGYDGYYKTADGVTKADIHILFKENTVVNYLVLKENIKLSQRVEKFEILNADGVVIYSGTTIGYKKIVNLGGYECKELTVRITDSRVCVTLAHLAVY